MKRIYFSMMLATLLATAGSANGQSLSVLTLQTLHEATACCADLDCSDACELTWYTQAVKHGAAAWQRVRALYTANSQAGKCCEGSHIQAKSETCQEAAGCPVGATGRAKPVQVQVQTLPTGRLILGIGVNGSTTSAQAPCCDMVQFLKMTCPLGFTSGTTPGKCCCAKECACCESCKAKPAAGTRGPMMPPMPYAMPFAPACPVMPTWSAPMPQAWSMPVPPPPGSRVVVALPTSGTSAKAAHLVTPDLEAHCQRITHRDGMIVLEGNVLLLRKKHAQPIRIEAQRVLVNMNDGSFTVESTGGPTPPPGFGVLRMSSPPAPPMVDMYYHPPVQGQTRQRIIEIPATAYPR